MFCHPPQIGLIHVLLLQFFDGWLVLKQLKYSRNFCTWPRRSISFNELKIPQLHTECFRSSKGHSRFLISLESSAYESKVLVFGFSQLWILILSNDEFVCAYKFSWIPALGTSHSLKTNTSPLRSRQRSCIKCNQWPLYIWKFHIFDDVRRSCRVRWGWVCISFEKSLQ